MSTLKKILALTLAIAMVLSLNVFAAFKDQDKIDEDCVAAMELMDALGILKGDDKGNANPEATITRAEAAAMIFRLMNKGKTDASMYNGMKIFTDVVSGIWYEGYVNYGYTMNIIQGRTATTFDPQAPVTGYEIAKMLLTCAGYDSEKQTYTGANWYKNVQNDAFAASILDNYAMALSAPAQRQWVAVMFADALNANMVKYYLGELSEIVPAVTLGEKKFDFKTAVGYLTSIEKNTLIEEGTVATGYSRITETVDAVNGSNTVTFKKVADKSLFGQQVKVYYKDGNLDKVYGVFATGKSVVGVSTMDAVTKSSTGAKYTVGNAVATAAETVVYVPSAATVTYMVDGGTFAEKYAEKSTAPVVAIDRDGDGDFEYALIDYSKYGVVTISKNGNMTLTSDSTLTVEKADLEKKVNFVNEVKDKSFVKATANVWTGKYDVEALTATVATLTRKDTSNNVYTIGGTAYKFSSDKPAAIDLDKALGSKIEFYTDGKFLVKATVYQAATAGEMGTLVMLTGKMSKTIPADFDNPEPTTKNYVRVLGLDGKVTEYEYADVKGMVAFENLDPASVYELKENTGANADTYSLKTLGNFADDKYVLTGSGSLTAKTARIGSTIVPSDAKFFVAYEKSEKMVYSVMTMAEITNNQTVAGYYTTKGSTGLTTAVVGWITSADVTVKTDAVYAITTNTTYPVYDETDAKVYYYMDVVYADGTKASVKVASTEDCAADVLATVTVTDGVADLTAVNVASLSTVNGVNATLIQLGNELKDIASDVTVIIKTIETDSDDNDIVFGTMDKVIDLYSKTGSGADYDYASVEAKAVATDSDEVTVLYVEFSVATAQ